MKNIFADYKTPTMAECEMLGKEIGLPKRVIQVMQSMVLTTIDILVFSHDWHFDSKRMAIKN